MKKQPTSSRVKKTQPTRATTPRSKKVSYEPTKMGLAVAALASISLVVLVAMVISF